MKKRGISLLFVLVILFTNYAHAEIVRDEQNTSIAPFYLLITSVHGTCYIEKGKLYMSGTVSSGLSSYAKVTITLQKNTGNGWKSDSSWSSTGTKSATKMAEKTAESGVLYRLKIYGYVSNDTASDSDTIYTGSVAL